MKLPNGYGSVSKLAGKRRKPYAARVTVEWTPDGKQIKKYLGYYRTRQEAMKALSDYAQNPFDLAAHDITFAELYDRWAKVKFKGPIELLEVKNENVKLDERYLIGGVKTEAGKDRTIPISEKIYPLVVSYLSEDRMTYQTLLRKWKHTPVLSGHLPHDGRHTCATLMDDVDIPLKIRQQILGHKSKDITNRVYTHKTIQQLVAAINRI